MITPIVDDPETFGRIAAVNAISDVFAMGARPLMALNVSCFSPKLPSEAAREILRGAQEAAREDGCLTLGGHTIKDKEVKFGLAVIGEVHPDRILRNRGARDGDALVLTKALGTSALATALKAGHFGPDHEYARGLVRSLTHSNRRAVEIALDFEVHAATDITGFGLSGHMREMLRASGVGARVEFAALPFLEGAAEMLAEGFTCGGAQANEDHGREWLRLGPGLAEERSDLLFDPQTAGPMLFSLPPDQAEALVAELHRAGYDRAARVGTIHAEGGTFLEVV